MVGERTWWGEERKIRGKGGAQSCVSDGSLLFPFQLEEEEARRKEEEEARLRAEEEERLATLAKIRELVSAHQYHMCSVLCPCRCCMYVCIAPVYRGRPLPSLITFCT